MSERETRDAPPHRVGLWHVGVVVSTITETPTARSIVLDVPGWGGNIAGQHADYLWVALKAYQRDKNPQVGRNNAIMSGMSRLYTPAELKVMAQYIGSLDGELKVVPQSSFR